MPLPIARPELGTAARPTIQYQSAEYARHPKRNESHSVNPNSESHGEDRLPTQIIPWRPWPPWPPWFLQQLPLNPLHPMHPFKPSS